MDQLYTHYPKSRERAPALKIVPIPYFWPCCTPHHIRGLHYYSTGSVSS